MNILYIHFFPFLKKIQRCHSKNGLLRDLSQLERIHQIMFLRRQMYVYTTDEHSGSVCEIRQNASYIPLVP